MLHNPVPERKIQFGLALLWLLLHTLFFWKYGVRTTDDSQAYLTYANEIAENFYFDKGYYLKYVGYPLFLALFLKIGFNLEGIVIIQTIISGLSTIVFYKTTKLLSGNVTAPILATFLLIIWYDMQMNHAFIMTESLYISLFIFAFYYLAKARTIKQSLWALPILIYIGLVRPNGFIGLAGYCGYVFTWFYLASSSRKVRIRLVAFAILVPVMLVVVVDRYLLQSFTIVETYEKGELIYMYRDWLVYSDKPIVMPPDDASPLQKMFLFVKENTSYFFRMSLYRFLLFWGNIKPYFSLFHNLVIAAVLYPMYFFMAKAMLRGSISAPLSVFAALLLWQQAFITTVTSEYETGRYLLSLISFVFMLGTIGLISQVEKWVPKLKSRFA